MSNIFNSRNETAKHFKCDKSQIAYGRYYKKGNKKNWKFELMIQSKPTLK